jgi:hypothetical protein
MQNLNEILPKYIIKVNGKILHSTNERVVAMDDYRTIVYNSKSGDRVDLLENNRVTESSLVE